MLIYILFFSVVFISLLLGEKRAVKGLNFYWLSYFIIFLFSALRFDVGYDFIMYYEILNKKIKYYDAMLGRLEYFNRVIINFSQETQCLQFFFIITSFLIIYLNYKTIKEHSKDFTISTLVFLSFPIFFFNSLSIVRQYVAISIIFYSFKYIKTRKLFLFLFVVTIAFLFHKSAILAIVLYWLYNKKVESKYLFILFFAGLFFSDLAYYVVEYLMPEYLMYLDRKIGVGGDKLLLIFQIIGFLLLFLVNKVKRNEVNNFYILVFFIGLFIWSSLAPYGHAGFRGGLYFIVFFILLLPEVYDIIKEKKMLKQLTYLVCFSFFIFTLWVGIKNPNKDPNIPYRVYFLTDKTDFKIDKR